MKKISIVLSAAHRVNVAVIEESILAVQLKVEDFTFVTGSNTDFYDLATSEDTRSLPVQMLLNHLRSLLK